MAIANRWAVRNVAKATFLDITTEKMITYLENLKSSDIEVSSETVYSRGGDGNPKLIGFSSNKEVKVNLSSAIFDNRALALLTGNSIITGVSDVYKREIINVTLELEDKVVSLNHTPKDGVLLGVYLLGVDGVESTEFTDADYTLVDKKLSFTTEEIMVGDKIVVYYITNTADTTQTITVSSDAFPGAFKLILEVLVTDLYTKALFPAQIEIPSCKMEDNWQLSFRPDGEPEPMSLPIEVLKSTTSNDMFTLKIYETDESV